jgi:hypothetical protein
MNAATARRVVPLFADTIVCLHPGCGHIVSAPRPSERVDAFHAHVLTHLPSSGPGSIRSLSSGPVHGETARTSSPADTSRSGAGPINATRNHR